MRDRNKRLLWTVLAVMLPGPWTPVIVLVYLLGRAAERDQDVAVYEEAPPCLLPGHYARVPAPPDRDPYAPQR